MEGLLTSPADVIRALLTYTDWWQPATTSILEVGNARRRANSSDAYYVGVLGTLDERTELCRRMSFLGDRDRRLLFLWYVKQLSAMEIARAVHISRRQCFRVRANAVRKLVELGEPDAAA